MLGQTLAIVHESANGYAVFHAFELFFTSMFCLEVVVLVSVYGWFVYWSSYKQRFDFMLTFIRCVCALHRAMPCVCGLCDADWNVVWWW